MRVNFSLLGARLLVAAGLLLCGCGNNAYKISAQDLAAFKDAPPEIKASWEKGLQADQANDYLAASTNYRSILTNPKLTPDQLVAVQTALGGLNYRVNEAAAKGNAAAKQALEATKAGGSRK